MKTVVSDLAQTRCIEAVFTGGDVAWTQDGQRLFATCTDTVKEINLQNNLETREIGGSDERGRVTALTIDEERRRLFVAYNSGLICEYSMDGDTFGTTLRTWKPMHTAPILIMKFNADFSLFATASSDNNIKIWDVRKQICLYHFTGSSVVTYVAFVQNGKLLAGYMDGVTILYSLNPGVTNRALTQWQNHQGQISYIGEIKDSREALIVSRDQICSIVDVESTKKIKALPLFEAIEDGCLLGDRLFTVGEKGEIVEWECATARRIRSKKLAGHGLNSISYNAATQKFLVISAEEIIYVLNQEFDVERQLVGFHDEIFSTAILDRSENFPGYLVAAANTSQIRLYNMESWDCKLADGHSDSVLCVRTPIWDHSLLASSSKDNSILLWKLVAGRQELEQIALGDGHLNSVVSVAFSHSGKQPFILSVSYDTTLKLWDLRPVIKKGQKKPEELPKLASSSTIVAHQKNVTCVDCAPNDSLCLTASMDKTAKIWKIDTGKMQLGIAGTLSGHKRGVWDAKFSPNAQKVVTCSGDQTLKIFNVSDCTCLHTLSGHTFAVLKAEWINNASQIISADSGGVLKLWKLENNGASVEASIEAHDDKIWTMTPTNDESGYITAGSDGKIILWKDVSEEKREKQEQVRRENAEQEQTLSNLISQERFDDALQYALGLNRPYCALKVVNKLVEREALVPAISRLESDQLAVLLGFVTQWNTNSRTATISQQVLQAILLTNHPDQLLKLPNIAQTIQALLPYTKRHVYRLYKAQQDVSLLDYTMSQMRIN
ncbi:unnamed protein product, partial [Mesorhabditis spiculigera]